MDSHSKIKWDWKKKTVLGVGIVLLVLQAVRMTVDGKGDFNLHWESGRRLVTGDDLYYFGLNCPYPPFWALVHAPLSFLPIPVAQLLFYPLFLVAFLLLGRTLRRMTKGGVSQPSPRFSLRGRGRILEPAHHEPPHAGSVEDSVPSHLGRIDANARFWIFVGAVLLTSRFLVRDMMECGVNLLMVALAWFAIELWSRHKEKRAGLWLGLAISLKCTPALFLLFFAWKRQWRMVRWTMVFVVGFTLSPILVMGPQKYVSAMTYWTTMSWRGFGKSDPSLGTLGQEPIQNDALRPALARFFMHLPKDHKARLDHPFYFDFLNLDPAVAGWMIRILILVLVITIVRRIPRSVEERRGWNMLWECTMVSVMLLLLSPITWGQHCVGVLPAFYTILWTRRTKLLRSRWVTSYLVFYSLAILVLNRTVIGKTGSLLFDSYHISTWCLLLLVFTILHCRDRQQRLQSDLEAEILFSSSIRRQGSAFQQEQTPQATQTDDTADPIREHIQKIA